MRAYTHTHTRTHFGVNNLSKDILFTFVCVCWLVFSCGGWRAGKFSFHFISTVWEIELKKNWQVSLHNVGQSTAISLFKWIEGLKMRKSSVHFHPSYRFLSPSLALAFRIHVFVRTEWMCKSVSIRSICVYLSLYLFYAMPRYALLFYEHRASCV